MTLSEEVVMLTVVLLLVMDGFVIGAIQPERSRMGQSVEVRTVDKCPHLKCLNPEMI